MRTYVYIDGFNLYYGALKNTPYKWLDLKSIVQKILQPQNIVLSIKYFTALVSSSSQDPGKTNRQTTYIHALENYIPEIEIYYGTFLTHQVMAPSANQGSYNHLVPILKTEEKGSDVNLAVHLLNDAWLNSYDCGVIISNDSDLAEAMKLVKKHHNKLLGVVSPFEKKKGSKELMEHADFCRKIRKGALKKSQLPDKIPGTHIKKPSDW